MADYWKSQPRKFCQYCKCWIADNKPSIEFHERGKNHKENVAAKIAEIKKKSVEKAKQEKRMSKEFAAMEEAAQKAYQEDLKRMGMESVSGAGSCQTSSCQSLVQVQPPAPRQPPVQPQIKKHPKKKDKSKQYTRQKKELQTWVEGTTDDGNTYYYNTITGESQWERPDSFQGGVSNSALPGTNESFTGIAWVEGISPDGYTYYYNTETGESSWKKPEDFLSSEGSGSGEVKSLEETSTTQPLSRTEDTPSDVQNTTPQAEVSEQPTQQSDVPKMNFRKRKSEDTPSEKEGEVKSVNTLSHEDAKEKEENVKVTTTETEKKTEEETKRAKEQTTNAQPIQKKEMTQAKRPKGANPYGSWEQIKEEEDPYSKVDLQLPQMDEDALAASVDLPPEPKPKFKERIITSLGVEGGSTSFKKTKTQNGKSRRLRQRDDDD